MRDQYSLCMQQYLRQPHDYCQEVVTDTEHEYA
jgi:hypothetical protein